MKIFTKTALACVLMAGAAVSSAETVEIRDASGDLLVRYSSSSVTVEGGVVTLNNGEYLSGFIPGIIPGTEGLYTCGENTTADEENNICIGSGGGSNISCGTGTELNDAEDQCVVAIPPTLNITGVSSMGDGVSTATLTFQFSRPVQGFTVGDISVSQGSISNFTQVNSSRWTATYNRSGNSSGTVTVTVSAGSYQGTNGVNGGAASRNISLTGGTTGGGGGNCSVSGNVAHSSHAAMAGIGGSTNLVEFIIPRQPGILTRSFTTPSGTGASGQIDLAGITATSALSRRMWISNCGGGAPLANSCNQEGNLLTMRYLVGAGRGACVLQPNTTYYFNISHANSGCSAAAGCGAYIDHKGGWR